MRLRFNALDHRIYSKKKIRPDEIKKQRPSRCNSNETQGSPGLDTTFSFIDSSSEEDSFDHSLIEDWSVLESSTALKMIHQMSNSKKNQPLFGCFHLNSLSLKDG
jgi:hypothetical protein